MDSSKNQIRVMGQYSISKSFKGILRIAHIIDLIEGDPDVFLNPTYYGIPKTKLDISGKESKQKGVDSAVFSLKGDNTITRYNSEDPLKNRRVPMTDSMGNYLNWNVGNDGITIGSEQEINNNYQGYDIFYQKENKEIPIYQKKFFPIFETKEIIIGKNNKQHRLDDKSTIGIPTLSLEGQNTSPSLIIENLYDKTESNRTPLETDDININIADYNNLIKNNNYKKIRTIYKDTKQYEQLYDVLMYRQNNWDIDNYKAEVENFDIATNHKNDYNSTLETYKQGQLLDCTVDTENIVNYVKKIIQKYVKGNIIQTPTGTVIWQYCSLDKWRSYGDVGTEGSLEIIPYFTGNRPTLETRIESTPSNERQIGVENVQPFFSSLIQGACKKINRLKKTSKFNSRNISDLQNDAVSDNNEDSLSVQELIPLYKRDYVLCDGSVYRIPFYPSFKNTNLLSLKQHMDRFFELFFNIGYKYTPREKLLDRPLIGKYTINGKVRYCLMSRDGKKIIPKKFISNIDTELEMEKIPWNSKDDYREIIDNPCNFTGTSDPYTISVTSSNYNNLKDTQILFEEDLATMLAITEIYNYYKTLGMEKPDYQEFYNNIKNLPLPQKYIFNAFIGDKRNAISVPYTNNNILYEINIGRQVNSLSSKIQFYNNNTKTIETCSVVDLPMVNIFLQYFLCLDSTKVRSERDLINLFYLFFNYNFCVPSFLSQEMTPTFLGSGGYSENDENRTKIKKVIEWKCKYSHATVPHRHAVFAGKSLMDDLNTKTIPSHYKKRELTTSSNNPANIANFYDGSLFKFNSFYKKGGWTHTKTQTHGNYIINQFHPQLEGVKVDNKFTVNIMYNTGNPQYETKEKFGYGWKTGPYRQLSGFSKNGETKWNDVKNIQTFEDQTHYSKQNINTLESERINYKNEQLQSWYGLLPYEDPRFDTSQPNRGLTSEPISTSMQINISYKKLSDNKSSYGAQENNLGDYGWFSPEHITMLPLIKL